MNKCASIPARQFSARGRRYNDGRCRVESLGQFFIRPYTGLSRVDVMSAPLITVPFPVKRQAVEIDSSCVIHPFYIHKMDSGPVRLMTIAHAFNYRVAVLRDGVRSAVRVGRSRKAENCFLKDVNISWGQQVTVMFQLVST